MGDDGCSASDLRRRYHMGGELKDDHLTAPQLRARYGIKKNTAGTYIGAMHEYYMERAFLAVYSAGFPLVAGVAYAGNDRVCRFHCACAVTCTRGALEMASYDTYTKTGN